VSYQVFARKYRPRTFDDVLGQDHVVRTLRNSIEQKRLAHAYLFVGPRGTGKTSTARILAKALNCSGGPSADFDPNEDICLEIAEGRSLDVLEIDGASNNGIDQVRELRDNVKFAPARGTFKIYYIDEVHMLSNQAFNALLKTLEEPPPHVKFIFATTEANKILPTIISRCQRFDLRPIPTDTIAKHLLHIASEENVKLDAAAAWAIAKGADGGMRDAQSMLDQLVSFCGESIHESNVLDIFGFTSRETVAALSRHLLRKETAAALGVLQAQAETGKDLSQLLGELIGCLRTLLVAKVDPNAGSEGIPEDLWTSLLADTADYPAERLLATIDVFAETDARMKWATNKRLHFEMGIIKSVQALSEVRLTDVIRILAGGADFLPAPAAAPVQQPISSPPAAPPAAPAVAEAPALPEISAAAPVAVPVAVPVAAPAAQPLEIAPAEKKTPSPTSRLDDLIASAPDHPEEEPPPFAAPPVAAAPAVTVEQAKAATKSDASDAFYNDPLINKALEIFQGSLKR
jgi:DNA polymerase-3 subunit gamma/tau